MKKQTAPKTESTARGKATENFLMPSEKELRDYERQEEKEADLFFKSAKGKALLKESMRQKFANKPGSGYNIKSSTR